MSYLQIPSQRYKFGDMWREYSNPRRLGATGLTFGCNFRRQGSPRALLCVACRHASLTTTFLYFLCVFSCVVWLWRPRNQLQFWMQFPAPGAARGSFVCGVVIGFAQSNIFHLFFTFSCVACSYISFSKPVFGTFFQLFPFFLYGAFIGRFIKRIFLYFFTKHVLQKKKLSVAWL